MVLTNTIKFTVNADDLKAVLEDIPDGASFVISGNQLFIVPDDGLDPYDLPATVDGDVSFISVYFEGYILRELLSYLSDLYGFYDVEFIIEDDGVCYDVMVLCNGRVLIEYRAY